MDSYLFGLSTENPENAKFISKLIIERATGIKVNEIEILAESEKQFKEPELLKKGIRLDLYIREHKDGNLVRVYDIEPNNYHSDNLPKRSRYYQSLIDSKLLESENDYEDLPEFISIWILPYDLLGEGRIA